jgi:hypothetical protein
MKSSKVLADLVKSAAYAKVHYEVWWTQVSEAKPQFVDVMNKHNDFFRASQNAHYTAFFIYLAQLFDKSPDSSSLPKYFELIHDSTETTKLQELEVRYDVLAKRAAPLVKVRHKTVAHVDARLSEKDVFLPLNITWNEIRSIIMDSASFVEELDEATHPDVAINIPRDGRLKEATMKLLRALNEKSQN